MTPGLDRVGSKVAMTIVYMPATDMGRTSTCCHEILMESTRFNIGVDHCSLVSFVLVS